MDTVDLETSELTLNFWVKNYQKKYFSDVAATSGVSISAPDEGPACFLIQQNIICLHPSVAPFIKLCRLLILHEMIHSKLFKKHGAAQSDLGEEFQKEVKRLWDAGAYRDLL